MTVGEFLDQTAAGLARAHALLRDRRAGSIVEQASVAVSRTRMFRELERHTMLLGGNPSSGEDKLERAARVARAPAQLGLRVALREATVTVTACVPVALPEVPVTGEIGAALHRAVTALGAANDVIAGNLGAGRARPPTPEGVALAGGYRQRDNLAVAGELVRAAAEIDARLRAGGWLTPGADAGVWRPLLLAVEADMQRTDQSGLQEHGARLQSKGSGKRAPVRQAYAVPAVEDPVLWTMVGSGRAALDALDAARVWLLRHGGGLTAGQAAGICRAALTISAHAGHILVSAGGNPETAGRTGRLADTAWRDAASAAGILRSAEPGGEAGTALVAMRTVGQWLDGRLRSNGRWVDPSRWADTPRKQSMWRRLAGGLAARLPQIAELVGHHLEQTRRQGNVLRPVPAEGLDGHEITVARWERAPAGDPAYESLGTALARAKMRSGGLAREAGVALPAGLRETVDRRAGPPIAIATPAHVSGEGPRGSAGVPAARRPGRSR